MSTTFNLKRNTLKNSINFYSMKKVFKKNILIKQTVDENRVSYSGRLIDRLIQEKKM